MIFSCRGGSEKQGRRTEFDNFGAQKKLGFLTREACKRRIREEGKKKGDIFFFLVQYILVIDFSFSFCVCLESD